jgi:hypothetical protein
VGPLLRALDGAWARVPYSACLPLLTALRALPAPTTWPDVARPLSSSFSLVHLQPRFGDALPYVTELIHSRGLLDALGVACDVTPTTAVPILAVLADARSVLVLDTAALARSPPALAFSLWPALDGTAWRPRRG